MPTAAFSNGATFDLVKVIIRNLQKRIPINSKKITRVILKALSDAQVKKFGEIEVCFMDDEKIRELNLMYLARNVSTDVIAFDISENKKEIFANIAVSADTAIRNAKIFKTSAVYELYLYVIHGILHLLGYKDETKKDKIIMRKKEEDFLRALNL